MRRIFVCIWCRKHGEALNGDKIPLFLFEPIHTECIPKIREERRLQARLKKAKNIAYRKK